MRQTIQEKIKQRRRQMLVHSYIYYELDQNIISDSKWSQWAMELVELQNKYPKESEQTEFYEDFKDWDGSSGAFLKFGEDIISVANLLLKQKDKVYVKPKEKPIKKVKSATKSLF